MGKCDSFIAEKVLHLLILLKVAKVTGVAYRELSTIREFLRLRPI